MSIIIRSNSQFLSHLRKQSKHLPCTIEFPQVQRQLWQSLSFLKFYQEELIHRKQLATRESIIEGTYYQQMQKKSSFSTWFTSIDINFKPLGLIFSTDQQSNRENIEISSDTEIVNIDFLKRQSEVVLRWAARMEKEIFNEKQLRRSIRDSKVREEDIDLIIKHLECTGKLAVTCVKISNQDIRLLKLGKIKGKTPVISEKEKATFALEENIVAIEQKVSELQIKVQKMKSQIQQSLKNGMRDHAKFLLLKKKNLEKFWQKLDQQKHLLEDNLMNIEEIENQSVIFDALKYAEQAGTSINKEIGDYEDLLDKIEEQKSQQQKIQMLVQDQSGISKEQESDLMQELEELECNQAFNQLIDIKKKPETPKLIQGNNEDEIRKIQQQLNELSVNQSEVTSASSAQRKQNQEEEKQPIFA